MLQLAEFEADLHVAAVEIELGYLIFFRNSSVFKILDILWFHSFLYLTRVMARHRSKFDQSFGRRGEHLSPGSSHGHHVFDANPELARPVNSGLNSDNHAGQQPCRLSGTDARRLVNLQADTVTGGVRKCFGQTRFAQTLRAASSTSPQLTPAPTAETAVSWASSTAS